MSAWPGWALALLPLKAEVADCWPWGAPLDLRRFSADLPFDFEVKIGRGFAVPVRIEKMENLDQSFEEVGFAAAILADKDVDELFALEIEGKIAQVLVAADRDGAEAH